MKIIGRSGLGMRIPPGLNPRRSLAAGVLWLVVALAAAFSVAASLWVGSIARQSVIEQHKRRLSLETDQLSSALMQAFVERLSAIRATESFLRGTPAPQRENALREMFAELRSAYPQLDWMAVAATDGTLIDGDAGGRDGIAHDPEPWVSGGLAGPWIGTVGDGREAANAPVLEKASLGAMAAPAHDASGKVIGVICARLSWRRLENHPQRLTDALDDFGNAQAYLLGTDGVVLAGPRDLLGQRWPGIRSGRSPAFDQDPILGPRRQQLPDGSEVLVSRELISLAPEYPALSWFVQLSEPRERAYKRANTLALRILGVSSLLAALTALLGIVGALHLTRRLRHLTSSVTAAGQRDSGNIDVPPGSDEVARLGIAFAQVLGALYGERRELENRVAVRTREVERLAEDARYAAIVRERLKIARDLHDTLAHSMMAILSEIRYLRRLQVHDPQLVAKELGRAEEVAHEGLKEVRSAITQMRVSTVRETGLGEALTLELERFVNRTGIAAEISIQPEASRFADERAEILLRMTQEALRNIERHSMSTAMTLKLHVMDDRRLSLEIEDNGVGFDPSAPKPGHYGLVGLREQADLIGAVLQINSSPDRGTQLRIEVSEPPVSFQALASA